MSNDDKVLFPDNKDILNFYGLSEEDLGRSSLLHDAIMRDPFFYAQTIVHMRNTNVALNGKLFEIKKILRDVLKSDKL
jgi:hypothetical protein